MVEARAQGRHVGIGHLVAAEHVEARGFHADHDHAVADQARCRSGGLGHLVGRVADHVLGLLDEDREDALGHRGIRLALAHAQFEHLAEGEQHVLGDVASEGEDHALPPGRVEEVHEIASEQGFLSRRTRRGAPGPGCAIPPLRPSLAFVYVRLKWRQGHTLRLAGMRGSDSLHCWGIRSILHPTAQSSSTDQEMEPRRLKARRLAPSDPVLDACRMPTAML